MYTQAIVQFKAIATSSFALADAMPYAAAPIVRPGGRSTMHLRLIPGGKSAEAVQELRSILAEAAALDTTGAFGEPLGPERLRDIPRLRQDPEYLQLAAGDLLRVGHHWRRAVRESRSHREFQGWGGQSKRELQATIEELEGIVDDLGKRLLEHGLLLFDPDQGT